eukprot:3489826-Pleurochrysis_carterae.AAC.1
MPVGTLGSVFLRLACAVTMPVLAPAMAACAVLWRPLLLKRVRFVVALGIDALTFELIRIRHFVVAVPFG